MANQGHEFKMPSRPALNEGRGPLLERASPSLYSDPDSSGVGGIPQNGESPSLPGIVQSDSHSGLSPQVAAMTREDRQKRVLRVLNGWKDLFEDEVKLEELAGELECVYDLDFEEGLREAVSLKSQLHDHLPSVFDGFTQSLGFMLARLKKEFSDKEGEESLVRVFNLQQLRVSKIEFLDSDLHARFERVMLITFGFPRQRRVVYKPAAVDGSYLIQGKLLSERSFPSLASLLGKWVDPNMCTLPTFLILRRIEEPCAENSFEERRYGFAEYLERPTLPSVSAEQHRVLSRCVGGLLAIVHILGIYDLHLENVLVTKCPETGKVLAFIIDGECWFSKEDDVCRQLFGDVGAFNQPHDSMFLSGAPTKNSTFVLEINGIPEPDEKEHSLISRSEAKKGFMSVMEAIKLHNADVVEWVRRIPFTRAVIRYLPARTATLQALRMRPENLDHHQFKMHISGLISPDANGNKPLLSVFGNGGGDMWPPNIAERIVVPAYYIVLDQIPNGDSPSVLSDQKLHFPNLKLCTSTERPHSAASAAIKTLQRSQSAPSTSERAHAPSPVAAGDGKSSFFAESPSEGESSGSQEHERVFNPCVSTVAFERLEKVNMCADMGALFDKILPSSLWNDEEPFPLAEEHLPHNRTASWWCCCCSESVS